MEREQAVAALPATYRQVLQWREAGRSDDEIAVLLDVELTAVWSMTRLAEAKLARLELR